MSKIQGITYEPPVREEFKMPTLDQRGLSMGLSVRIQREDIFNAMHRI